MKDLLNMHAAKVSPSTENLPALSRRSFVVMSVSGTVGLALLPLTAEKARGQANADAAAKPAAGQSPTELPSAFVSIDKNGVVTVLCNRLDMGQGIETALAMICAEELDADWGKVKTGFGDQRQNFVDPKLGLHLTGGSNSVKNSYTQYRELGARTKAMLMSAASKRLGLKPDAVMKAENGVVRSGNKSIGYGELFEAAMQLPVPENVSLKNPADFKLIGKPTSLTTAQAKSTGQQKFGMDVKLPGMLTALLIRPPVFGAKYQSYDAAAAEKVAGVVAVLPIDLDRGAKGLAVVAQSYWQAKMGRDAVKVEWDSSGIEKVDTTALLKEYRELAQSGGTLVPEPKLQADTSKIATAPRKLNAEFSFPYLNHAQMEPLACTIDLKADSCKFYTASQMPGVDSGAIARSAGLKPEQVSIEVQMGGGGFGRRAVPTSDYVLTALSVAKALAAAGKRAPVKVVWSREDDMQSGYYRPLTVHRAEIGYDEQGTIVGWEHKIVSQSILKGTPFEGFGLKNGTDATTYEGMKDAYQIPINVSVRHPIVNVPVLWWRSVGSTHTAFVMETLIDEIAEDCKIDPVAYRMKLFGDSNPRHKAALQLAVDKSGYGKKTLADGLHWGVAVHESFDSVVAWVVEAGVKDDGFTIQSITAGVHCNTCINPRSVEAQVQGSAIMAISTLLPDNAITLVDGVVQQGNFHQYPVARLTDAPKNVAVHIVPSNDPPKGMGEPALPPLAPAVANALRRATGKNFRELPLKLA